MTGEVTLTGRVLPVGGVREKILAARRAGIKSVLIPRHNEKDLVEIPAEVKADLSFHLVDTLDDVVPRLFERLPRSRRARRRAAKKTPPRVQADRRSRIEAQREGRSVASAPAEPARQVVDVARIRASPSDECRDARLRTRSPV